MSMPPSYFKKLAEQQGDRAKRKAFKEVKLEAFIEEALGANWKTHYDTFASGGTIPNFVVEKVSK